MNNTYIKYPEVTVKLSGGEGNALQIINDMRTVLRIAGVEKTKIEECTNQMTSGSYENLLYTASKWVTIK